MAQWISWLIQVPIFLKQIKHILLQKGRASLTILLSKKKNLIEGCIYFTVRLCIEATGINFYIHLMMITEKTKYFKTIVWRLRCFTDRTAHILYG
jgi:hypothetical protein